MINKENFCTKVIANLFNGSLSEKQQSGLCCIIDEWDKQDNSDIRQLAYVLATIYHETDRKMQPVQEAYYLKDKAKIEAYLKSKSYYPYYGRDITHTTWVYNYQKVKDFTGIDVVTNPDLIGQMPLAAEVAITFMLKGWYTGKKLSDYFNDTKEDALNARRIINGLDCAEKVLAYYHNFLNALK